MAFDDVTAEYVDLLSYNKYAAQTADTATFEAIKSQQSQYINTARWPDKKVTHGLSLLVCHYYAMGSDVTAPEVGTPDTEIGPITSEKVGNLSQTRGLQPYIGTVEGHKTWLLQTTYGVQFLYLTKTFKSSPSVL